MNKKKGLIEQIKDKQSKNKKRKVVDIKKINTI